jgi:PIN domain nuclease of toxin-antitoxin system
VSEVVLDASALLAYLHEEPGAEAVEQALAGGAWIGAANWAEVLSKVAVSGGEPEALIGALEARGILGQALEVLPLLPEDGLTMARLRPSTKALGLSLGDRACLALGLRLGRPILTTDQAWGKLALPVDVRVVR